MPHSDCQITLHLDPGPNMSQETLRQHTSVLLRDIRHLEGVEAELELSKTVTLGHRGDPITIGTIVIAMIGGGAVSALIQFVRDWALRGENRKVSIEVKVDDSVIKMEYIPSATTETELLSFAQKISDLIDSQKKHHQSKHS